MQMPDFEKYEQDRYTKYGDKINAGTMDMLTAWNSKDYFRAG